MTASKPEEKRWHPENTAFGYNMKPTTDGDFVLFCHHEAARAADKARIAELEKRSEGLLGLYREAESELKQCVIDRASFSDELRACTESPGGCGYWREAAKHRTGERDHALARIAELEAAIKDPETVFLNMKRGAIATPSVRLWSKLFGEVLNDDDAQLLEIARLRERVTELEAALRNIAAEVDGNIRECVRDCVNQRGNVQDIYDYCDRIDSTVGEALSHQGKEIES